MTTDEVFLNPDAVKKGASNLGSAADALSQAWKTFSSTTTSLHASNPWGDDEPGEQFNKQYMAGEAVATKVIDATGEMVGTARRLGPQVGFCVDGTVDADDFVANMFGKKQ